jgi:hypothetical protein
MVRGHGSRHSVQMGFDAAAGSAPPLIVPIIFTAWAVILWFVAGRKMVRDPHGEFRKMAQKRARSRIVRTLGGSGNVDTEFESLWRARWLFPAVSVLYVLMLVFFWVRALAR